MSDLRMIAGDGSTAFAVRTSLGKKITAVKLEDKVLTIEFEDKSRLALHDDGQMCCERRYMRTDDNLVEYVGDLLIGIGLRDAPNVECGEDDDITRHQVQFLVVKTSSGEFVMSNHNENRGYYGGFSIEATLEGLEPGKEDGEYFEFKD